MNLFGHKIESTDQTFLMLRNDPDLSKQRDLINSMFGKFEPYADKNFAEAFPHQCHSRFWELYLGAAFLANGIDLVPRKERRDGGSDICIRCNGQLAWIEAVAPKIGDGPDSTPLHLEKEVGIAHIVPEDQIILRFSSAITEKHTRHLEHIKKGYATGEQPFLVAINGAALGSVGVVAGGIPYPIRAVLPFGPYSIQFDPKTGRPIADGYQFKPQLAKQSGSIVRTDIFLDSDFSLISGLLFSNVSPFYFERPTLSNVGILHNYLPKNPFPKRSFTGAVEFVVEKSEQISIRPLGPAA